MSARSDRTPEPAARSIPGAALAIDHGTVRHGFAVCDALGITTRALEAFEGGGEALFDHVEELCEERDVRTLIVGLPLNMDGSEGPRAAEVRAFARALEARFPSCAVVLQDERLSTKEAEELLRDADVPRRERRAWKDSFSAIVVLRDWLREAHPREDG